MKEELLKDLIHKYLNGQCTPEEVMLMDKWYALLDKKPSQELLADEWETLEAKLWTNIKATALPKPVVEEVPNKFRIPPFIWGVAASVSIIIGCWIGFGYWSVPEVKISQVFTINKKPVLLTKENSTDKPMHFSLYDGSTISLMPQSAISYPKERGEVREFFLEGEAFFEVKKDTQRPFLVHAGAVVTKVLGTSFTIKKQAGESGSVLVAVKTGRVAVGRRKEITTDNNLSKGKGIILMPNQQTTYHGAEKRFHISLVTDPALLSNFENRERDFSFKDKPIREVAALLEKAYGIQVSVAENLLDCPITANLTEEDFYMKLNLICQALKASYKISGTKISIHGKGCDRQTAGHAPVIAKNDSSFAKTSDAYVK